MSVYVLFTGGRDYAGIDNVREVLAFQKAMYGDDLRVLHGDAKGADRLVAQVCRELDIKVKAYPAKWQIDGKTDKTAGFKRNQHMVDLIAKWAKEGHNALVVAFPGGNGTRHCSDVAEKAGLNVDYMPS